MKIHNRAWQFVLDEREALEDRYNKIEERNAELEEENKALRAQLLRAVATHEVV